MSWLILVAGYLVGALPTAYIAGRWQRGLDIRQLGDGNMGARNAYYQLGHRTGVTIFIVDVLKGSAPVLLAQSLGLPQGFVLAAGLATVIGHNWPVFIHFRGGRGEATTIGVFLALLTQPMLIVAGPALATLLLRRNVIAASCVLFVPLPLICWWLGLTPLLIGYSVALPVLVGLTHYQRTRQVSGASAGAT